MKMTGGDAILRSLEAEGVEVMFGIPGGAIMPTYDAMARGTTVRHVLARHEQGAGHMAQGYARASGRVGVAIATSGPGATNLVTPIADAWMDSTPLVCITGQVRSSLIGTDAFQECDITGITMPIVKHSWLVQEAREIPAVLKAAFHVARTGRCGPVLVDVPRDLQEADDRLRVSRLRRPPGVAASVEGASRCRSARRRGRSRTREKPVLYVGGGTLNGDACAELLELAEAGSLPVVTTLMGKSAFPETHELHFGWPGMHGAKWSNIAMNTCDVLVAIGARFDDRVTGKLSAFAPGATVVHLDIDPAEISKLRDADIPVVGPLGEAVGMLAAEVAQQRADGAPAPARLARADPGVARGVPAPLRHRRRVAQAAEGRRDAPGAHGRRGRDRHDRSRPASDVGDAVRRERAPAELHHVGRPRDDGLRDPRRDRREGGAPGGDRRLRRRRRLLPDDRPGAHDRGPRRPADRRRARQQRLPRDGHAVAGHVLRRPPLPRPPDDAGAGLRQARRGLRRRRDGRRERGRARAGAAGGARPRAHGRRRLPRRPGGAVLPDDPRRARPRST